MLEYRIYSLKYGVGAVLLRAAGRACRALGCALPRLAAAPGPQLPKPR